MSDEPEVVDEATRQRLSPDETMKLLVQQNHNLTVALRNAVSEVLALAKKWRIRHSSDDYLAEAVCDCADEIEQIAAVRAQRLANGDERIAEQVLKWQLELQQLPVFQPQRACLNKAMERLKDAVREMDGSEHPATWHLAQASRWMLAAIENNDERRWIK